MPGDRRFLQFKPSGECASDLRPIGAKRGERSGRAAELQSERVRFRPLQALGRVREAGEPDRGLVGERDRQRLLHQRAARHHGPAVFFDQRCERLHRSGKVGPHDGDRASCAKREAGVDRVLAGRAPMHVAARLLVDLCRQRLDERDGHVARKRRRSADLGNIVEPRVGGGLDRGNGGRRDDPHLRFRRRQRRLEIEHRLKARAVGEDFADGRRGENRRKESGRRGTRHFLSGQN